MTDKWWQNKVTYARQKVVTITECVVNDDGELWEKNLLTFDTCK